LLEGGIVFGVRSNEVYEQAEIRFGSGDRLVLLTDGITGAANDRDEEFGDQRLRDILFENRKLSSAEIQQKLLHAVESFAAPGFRDDATLVTVSTQAWAS